MSEARGDDETRERALVAWLAALPGAVVGFSGGVDSSYLAAVAVAALGPSRILAVTGRSASYPDAQWTVAREVAALVGVPHHEVETREGDDPHYAANPVNRCYYCKRELWSRLAPLAAARGFTLLDGTNADDLADHRPGAAAGREYGVRSPLAALGFTKGAIRRLSAALALPTAHQPSAPCLASRLPYGTPVTVARLARIERAESNARALGIVGDLRVRHHGDLARVELAEPELTRWLDASRRGELRRAVAAAGFSRVAIDLRGFRSGSLNVLHGVAAE